MKYLLLTIAAILLAGCGGSGGNSIAHVSTIPTYSTTLLPVGDITYKGTFKQEFRRGLGGKEFVITANFTDAVAEFTVPDLKATTGPMEITIANAKDQIGYCRNRHFCGSLRTAPPVLWGKPQYALTRSWSVRGWFRKRNSDSAEVAWGSMRESGTGKNNTTMFFEGECIDCNNQ